VGSWAIAIAHSFYYKCLGLNSRPSSLIPGSPQDRLSETTLDTKVRFLRAEFGNPLTILPRRVFLPQPDDGCEVGKMSGEAANCLVFLTRGICTFGLKAKTLMQRRAGAFGLINTGDAFPMQVDEEEIKFLTIEAITISESDGNVIKNAVFNKKMELWARFV
jgi:hypothetical protein